MKNLLYALKQVFRPRWQNTVKIISLTLGFAVSVALMCRVAWFNSFDNFWQDGENLLILEQHINWLKTGERDLRYRCFPAIAPEITANIPSVESATRFRFDIKNYLVNENQYSFRNCYVDSSFFDVLQMEMITGGNPKEILKNRNNAIISEKTAKMLFPDGDVLGQVIKNETNIYTVGGICKDLPENSFLPEIHIIVEKDIPLFFVEQDIWFTFLRTHKKTDLKELNKEINELLEPRYTDVSKDLCVQISFCASNFHDYSKRENRDVKGWIMVVILLLITGLNFALLSISSLASRAKEVGVRKASGARASGIFSLIIWETTIYVIVAACLAAVLLWGLKPQLDEMFGKFENIFAFENLWGVGFVMVLLILIAGVLPAWIFSRIPVTQVFQRFTSDRLYWKRILLFIQFMASIFVISLMFIALRQYDTVIAHRYGYEPDQLLWIYVEHPVETQLQTLVSEIGSDSRVEAVTTSSRTAWYGYTGMLASRNPDDTEPLYVQGFGTDSNFFKVHGIKMLYGNTALTGNWETAGNVVVNQAFLNTLQIDENPLEVIFYNVNIHNEKIPFKIAGVCQNFESLEEGVEPLVVMARDTDEIPYIIIRVNEVTSDVVQMVQEKIKQTFPKEVAPKVSICSDTIFWHFHRFHLDGMIVIFASICLLIITIVGTLGYVSIEIRRRTKEIAIRKIHGSSAMGIIWKISRELLLIALLASPMAIIGAYFFGMRWLRDFVVKATLNWYLFAAAACIIVLTIAACAVIQTWRTANANPAKEIKSE